MVLREKPLKNLVDFKDKKVIKVITGIRRCGKSTLLHQYRDYLLSNGIDEIQIVSINFESVVWEHLGTYRQLYDHVQRQRHEKGLDAPAKTVYLLLDEVQQVEQWEKALASFQVDFPCDIVITGSNAYLLSSELATLIAGRYVEIHLLPLSYEELLGAWGTDDRVKGGRNQEEVFDHYLQYGGFPGLLELDGPPMLKRQYLEGIYHTVVVKDILARTKVSNAEMLERILRYLVMHAGSLISANKVADYLTSNGEKTFASTVTEYLRAFENAFIVYKAERYDLRGKRMLRSPHKYYLADTGLKRLFFNAAGEDTGRMLENLVFLELKRRGYQVMTGVDHPGEIDFVAVRGEDRHYYQVSLSITDENVRKRELGVLQRLKDNHPKTLLTMDYRPEENVEGIRIQRVTDFLLHSG